MKKILFEDTYKLFLLAAIITFFIFIFFKGLHPESTFDVSIYSYDFSYSMNVVWLIFSGYLFFLTFLYFMIARSKLKPKRWLIILHFVFIVLFLVFFILFNSFSNRDVQNLMAGVPFSTLITMYAVIFFADISFFVFGILLLLLNILSLRRKEKL